MSKKKRKRKTPVAESPAEGDLRGILDGDDDSEDMGAVPDSDGMSEDGASPVDGHGSRPSAMRWLLDAYEILLQTIGIGLSVSMIVGRSGGNATLQWVVGIVAMMATILSRTVFANDIDDIYDEARQKVEEDRRRDLEELRDGNYDGVPKSIVEMLKYPTAEDYETMRAEAERQRQLLRDFKKTVRGKKGDESE